MDDCSLFFLCWSLSEDVDGFLVLLVVMLRSLLLYMNLSLST